MNARDGKPAEAPAPNRAAAAVADQSTPAVPAPKRPRASRKRKTALLGVTTLVVLAGIAYGVYYALVLDHYETTDNAYVQGNVVQLTPQVGGTVVAINADDTDFVKAGQLLVKLDPADARVALDQAEAQLGQTVREVRTLFVNNGALQAQIASREADLARAGAEVARAQDDVTRREPLVRTGAVGKEEFNHVTTALSMAKSVYAAAQSGALAAREQLASNQSLTQGVSVEQHPNVLRAAARVREAYLALSRADLVAPVDGFVAKRSVQLGQRVAAGTPLMSVIPLDQVWVEANFKEVQLRDMRIGQPVKLKADLYGNRVEYDGHVAGVGAGTGAAFAMLPAQNATGNWIKVVQRVPVRIALDPKEIAKNPLRVGLSMEVSIDVADQGGKSVADAPRTAQEGAVASTTVFDKVSKDADAEVARIIAENGGGHVAVARAPAAKAPQPATDTATAAASDARVASAGGGSDGHGTRAHRHAR